MGIFEALAAIEDLAAGRKSASILRDHVAFLRDQIQRMQESEAAAKEEARQAKEDRDRKAEELERLRTPHEFTEHRGVLFRRGKSGDFDADVYCPSCKIVMFSLLDVAPFKCSRCRFVAPFTGRDIHEVLLQIKQNH